METNDVWGWTRSKRASTGTKEPRTNAGDEEVLASTRRSGCSSSDRGKPQFDIELFMSSTFGGAHMDKCWHLAFSGLQKSCREILKNEYDKSQLALRWTDCFLKSAKKSGVKCAGHTAVSDCVKTLDEHAHSVFLAFYVDASIMCHYLQSEAFKKEAQNLADDLKKSASADNEDILIGRAETILEAHKQLQKEHALLHAKIEHGMEGIFSATKEAQELIRTLSKLQNEVSDTQQEIAKILAGEVYNAKSKRERKDQMVDNQMKMFQKLIDKLIMKTNVGYKGTKFGEQTVQRGILETESIQANVIQELKRTINGVGEKVEKTIKKSQEWYIEQNELLQRYHTGSVDNIKNQAALLEVLVEATDKFGELFNLDSSAFNHSRIAKSALFYVAFTMVIFVVTVAKRTKSARLFLLFGLFVTMTFEWWLVQYRTNTTHASMDGEIFWPPRKILLLRTFACCLGVAYLLASMCKYVDYDQLNHRLLKNIHKKFAKRTRFYNTVVEYEPQNESDYVPPRRPRPQNGSDYVPPRRPRPQNESDYVLPRRPRGRPTKAAAAAYAAATAAAADRMAMRESGARYHDAQPCMPRMEVGGGCGRGRGRGWERGGASRGGSAGGSRSGSAGGDGGGNGGGSGGGPEGGDRPSFSRAAPSREQDQYRDTYAYEPLPDDDMLRGARNGSGGQCTSESCGYAGRKQGRCQYPASSEMSDRDSSFGDDTRISSRRKCTRDCCPC